MEVIRILAKIMERICILNLNMDSILTKKPIQTYLDASLYNTVKSSNKKVAAKRKSQDK